MKKSKFKHITFCYESSLALEEKKLLVPLFLEDARGTDSVLGGRNSIGFTHLPNFGNVIVKTYTRGGLIHHFNKNRYVGIGETRSEQEFKFLKLASNIGVHVPEPVVAAYCGKPFYRAWLVLKEIENAQTLADIYMQDFERGQKLTEKLNGQVIKLIQKGIYHVDFHPGNVIVNPADDLYIIDFDKARTVSSDQIKLASYYTRRWNRALEKHHLPLISLNLTAE